MAGGRQDYSGIAGVYDGARPIDRPHVGWWLARLAQKGGLGPGKRLLDLGCGTGRWTIPLAERTGCAAFGLDASREMLARAREKDRGARVLWLLGDAHAPPLRPGSFDCALMSLMLHHLADPPRAFRAAHSLLRGDGVLLVRQGTLEQILDDPAHRFFTEAVEADRRRTPRRAEVEASLAAAGFTRVEVEEIRLRTHNRPEEWLVEAESRVCSVFRLVGPEAHARGLARLRDHVREHPDDPWLLEESMTLFVAGISSP